MPVKLRGLTLVLLTTLATCLPPQLFMAADDKASKYYEDALVRYETKDLAGAIIQLKNDLD